MSHKVLVTGQNGQLGRCLQDLEAGYPGLEMTFLSRQDLDLNDIKAIGDYFNNHTYDVIVNCAAYTAVDQAEYEPEQAEQINHHAVKALAEAAKQQNAKLIHISTDYVFNGRNYKPYIESDPVDPINVYGATKLRGEQAIQAINPAALIIRTSWVFSEYRHNFVKTMLRLGQEKDFLKVINDQVGSPTYAGDLAKAICEIISHSKFQQLTATHIYHFTNEGVTGWYDFAKAIFEISGIECPVYPIAVKDYPTKAARPYYSVLSNKAIKERFGLDISYWQVALKRCLFNLGYKCV